MKRIPGWLSFVATAVVVGSAFLLAAYLERRTTEIGAAPAPAPDEAPAGPGAANAAQTPAVVHAAVASERAVVRAAHSVDDYLTELADPATRFASGRLGNRSLHAGFYANGIVRLVDSAGRCYQGTTENAVARMREVDGSSTFDLRISVDERKAIRGAFHGGPYDGLTISFEGR